MGDRCGDSRDVGLRSAQLLAGSATLPGVGELDVTEDGSPPELEWGADDDGTGGGRGGGDGSAPHGPGGQAKLRGALLGLILADALTAAGGRAPRGGQPVANTVAAQLACVTVDGLIRSHVRGRVRGIVHPPTMVGAALVRWAHGQQIDAPELYAQWRPGDQPWPNGWLPSVPVLHARRGDAPATVTALRSGQLGTADRPVTGSCGAHALVRAAPAGMLTTLHDAAEVAEQICAQTHGHPRALMAASQSAVLLGSALRCDSVEEALDCTLAHLSGTLDADVDALMRAVRAGSGQSFVSLGQLVNGDGAPAALQRVMFILAAHPRPEQWRAAVREAGGTETGQVSAALVGAVAGAVHGMAVLPVALLSRCELVWVADTLARDLHEVTTGNPCGTEGLSVGPDGSLELGWVPGYDPTFCQRYPWW